MSVVLDSGLMFFHQRGDEECREALVLFPGRGHKAWKSQEENKKWYLGFVVT